MKNALILQIDERHNYLSIGKTEYIIIGSGHKTNSIDTEQGIRIENQVIKKVRNTKVLGVKLDENLSWEKHNY